jgi:putative peptidoglycan lipid II flippase
MASAGEAAGTVASGRGAAVARGVAGSAVIVAVGQLLSRLMGLVRVTVIANVFGAGAEVSAFNVASTVPTMVFDLLLGGMVSAALVPVLSDYVTRGDRQELERLTSTLLTTVAAFFILVVVLLELGAPLLALMVGGGFEPGLFGLTVTLIRLILPSLVFLCLWGVTAAVLYARQQFIFPALASAVFNLGVIIAALFLARDLGISALSLGVVLGSALQLLIVLPGLRGLRLRPRFELRHPALRRIVTLYMPVIASLLVAQLGIVIDRNLASRTVDQAIAWMYNATQLIQLPLGLVSVAIATAALPALARLTEDPENRQFRRTLAGALRLVIILIAPATIGLLVLGQEGIRVVLEHGAFTPFDTSQVTRALLFYLPGLPFAAIDQPLVFAFYARKDTVTPVVVGIASVGAYLLVGPLLAFVFRAGFIGLVAANAVQLTTHCIIMWIMLERRVGPMAGHGLLSTTSKAALSAVAAGLTMLATLALARRFIPEAGTLSRATGLLAAGGAGMGIYLLGLAVLRADELTTLANLARLQIRRPVDRG